MTRSALALVCAMAFLTGCGSSEADPQSAYLNLEKKLIAGDPAACELMSSDYQNKLAASAEKFSADCPEVVKKVQAGFREDPDLKTKSIGKVNVRGDKATLIASSTYDGKDVRTEAFLKRKADGNWILDKDRILDPAAPEAPVAAFLDYTKALRTANGERVCALSTARGKELLTNVLPESHGNGACEGAVPFLAVAASKQPEPDVIGGDVKGDDAALYVLQSDGNGVWVLRVVGLAREDGKWLFDQSRDIGRAPAPRAPSSPVT